MNQFITLTIYIMVFACISILVYYVSERDKTRIEHGQYIRIAVFFSVVNYFVLSLAKSILYASDATLAESFWDAELISYLGYYGIPMLIISIASPLLLKLIFRKRKLMFINTVDIIMFVFLTIVFIFQINLSNIMLCVAFVTSLVISLVYILLMKEDFQYIEQENIKNNLLDFLPCMIAWIVTIVIYLPNELYLTNYSQFSGKYGQFVMITFLGGIIIGLVVMAVATVGTLVLPSKMFKICSLILCGVICAGYVQSVLMNGNLQVLDGNVQNWGVVTKVINIMIWALIVFGMVYFAYNISLALKMCKIVCVYITLIQLVTFCVLAISTEYSQTNAAEAMTTKGALELSEGNNVLVFVLDRYESTWFEERIVDNEYLQEALSDFTYYSNTTSQFLHTVYAVPYMLTGVDWNEDIDESYAEYAYSNSDAVQKIAEVGYDIGIYTETEYLSDEIKQTASNYSTDIDRTFNPIDTLEMMARTSLYKITPFVLKQCYIYYSGDVFELSAMDGVWNIDNDLPFYNMLIDNGIAINSEIDNAFRFYHMRGPHAPCYLSENLKYEESATSITQAEQGVASLKIVSEYLEQMKELGIYDRATIIITTDHGQPNMLYSEKYSGTPEYTSRPLFLVKMPYEESEFMSESIAPISQQDLIPTIMQSVGIDKTKYGSGRCLSEIGEMEERERNCVDICDGNIIQFTINGVAWDLNSWSIKKATYGK